LHLSFIWSKDSLSTHKDFLMKIKLLLKPITSHLNNQKDQITPSPIYLFRFFLLMFSYMQFPPFHFISTFNPNSLKWALLGSMVNAISNLHDIVFVIRFGHEEMKPPMDWNVAQLDWIVIKCGLCILLSFRQFYWRLLIWPWNTNNKALKCLSICTPAISTAKLSQYSLLIDALRSIAPQLAS
jgi:hypothetical protein